MKKFNYLYFGLMTLAWFGIDRLLSVLTRYHPAWLLLLPVYFSWYLLSAPLFYCIRKRKDLREGFYASYCMQAQWATFWIDLSRYELAYLCMLNPLRIHYLPLNAFNDARVEVHYAKNREYIHFVNCSFEIYGKRNKVRVDTDGRGYRLHAETNGKKLVDRTRQFVDILNGRVKEKV
ncbi:MAG: hypothetical protein K2K90_06280 [Lachnospiraceae bacterium]|nr:hypothetical protein [Lachnospiraceae bacterium]